MNISMKAIDVKDLEEYIEKDSVPFAICVSKNGVPSKLLLPYLEKYYDKVVDRKGRTTYYCNIINPFKCRDKGYDTITLSNGKIEKIEKFTLRKHKTLKKFVVVSHLGSGAKLDAVSLTKTVSLNVQDVKKQVNGELNQQIDTKIMR